MMEEKKRKHDNDEVELEEQSIKKAKCEKRTLDYYFVNLKESSSNLFENIVKKVMEKNENVSADSFKYNCDCQSKIEDFKTNEKHILMFDNVNENEDKWDMDHAKLPCSQYNLDECGKAKWPQIVDTLKLLAQTLQKDQDSVYIENAIKRINLRMKSLWNFKCLQSVLSTESQCWLENVIPKIAMLAIELPNKLKKPIPLLKSGMSFSLTFTREQVASLLANSFFCTFPKRNNDDAENYELNSYPLINFNDLYTYKKKDTSKETGRKIEKLKCILNYFKRVTEQTPVGNITFTRRCVSETDFPDFKTSSKKFSKAKIDSECVIEESVGALQLDFANKYIGGGVLNSGCVQEEIRFVLCPELLISMLFCEEMKYNECILIKGAERYNSYTGYGDTFKWSGDFIDQTAYDACSRRNTEILAIDALFYWNPKTQFNEEKILRELKKAYCGFLSQPAGHNCSVIATGNWGAGVFRGDKQLKFLIQLICAALCDRDMIYYTFKDVKTCAKLKKLYEMIESMQLCVQDVYKLIIDYANEILSNKTKIDLCDFIKEKLNN